jgi:hypothetical protein
MTRIPRGLEAACHEAAHALVSLAVGLTFKCIRLGEETRDVPPLAKLSGSASAISRGQYVPTDEKIYRDGVLAEAKINLGGVVFEKLRCPWKTYFELESFECFTDLC